MAHVPKHKNPMENISKKKKKLTFEQKLANAEKLIKNKELNPNGDELFEEVLKRASTSIQRDSK